MGALDSLGRRKVVLGMIHLDPLPGTPLFEQGSFAETLDRAVESAVALDEGGADGCLIQTVDRVYSAGDDSDPARTAAMALIVRAVADVTGDDFDIGVQMMRNALSASLGVAKVAGGAFIRAGALVGMTLTPQGLVEANPLAAMEYRRKIDGGDIKVIADIDSMQFKWFGGGRSTARIARDAQVVGADAVALSDPDVDKVLSKIASVRQAVGGLPIVIAGDTDHANAEDLLAAADGAFVGACLEHSGPGAGIDRERVRAYTDIVRRLSR